MFGRLARTDEEFRRLTNRDQFGLVQSAEDFVEFTQQHADDDDHVLSKLEEDTIDEFGESLIFMNGGLAGARIDMLEDELSEQEVATLFATFGLSRRLAEDHKGYACISTGTCKSTLSHICTSNCYHSGGGDFGWDPFDRLLDRLASRFATVRNRPENE